MIFLVIRNEKNLHTKQWEIRWLHRYYQTDGEISVIIAWSCAISVLCKKSLMNWMGDFLLLTKQALCRPEKVWLQSLPCSRKEKGNNFGSAGEVCLLGEHDNLVLSSQSSSHLSFPVAASLRHTCWHHQQCLQEPKTREKWIKFSSLTEIVLEGFIGGMCSQCGGGCCPDSWRQLYKTVADEAHVQNCLPTSFLAMVTEATTLVI